MNKQLFFSALWSAVVFIGFLSSCNGSKKNTSTTVNGFEYTHHIKKEGAKPQIGEYVYFNIDVFVDDSLLQSSRDGKDNPLAQIPTAEQAKLQPNPVIDVLPLMSIGDSVTVSQYLDSFPQRPPGFDNYEKLIYNVSLTAIKSEVEYNAIVEAEQKIRKEKALVVQARLGEVTELVDKNLADYNSGKLGGKLTETASGLKYIIHEEGTGEVPQAGEPIDVHYYGVLTDGTMFDNSFSRGEFITFPVGQRQVIAGWDEGLMLMKKGTKATLFIPYPLAYGEQGRPPSIPEKSDLVFYVELLDAPAQ